MGGLQHAIYMFERSLGFCFFLFFFLSFFFFSFPFFFFLFFVC